jgi:hypothetical protein
VNIVLPLEATPRPPQGVLLPNTGFGLVAGEHAWLLWLGAMAAGATLLGVASARLLGRRR